MSDAKKARGKEAAVDTARYDRQLRLWGTEGQLTLQDSRICVLGATALAAEFLKNLVLPGIGSFCIVERRTVMEADVGHSFFVCAEDVGHPIAETVARHLSELNPLVRGEHMNDSPADLMSKNPNFLNSFHLVVCANGSASYVLEAANQCWRAGIPFIHLRSYGMFGLVRLVLKDHTVVETKADPPFFDLCVSNPFPALAEYASKFDLGALPKSEHAHVPFVLILIRLLEKWRKDHPGHAVGVPSTVAEKAEFRKLVESSRADVHPPEENFDDALHNLRYAFTPSTIPAEVKKVLDDPLCTEPLAKLGTIPRFFVLARAVKEFIENEGSGSLPVGGDLPDMTSDTKGYLALKKIYEQKAKEDAAIVQARVQAICAAAPGAEIPTRDFVKLFCKNAHNLLRMQHRPLSSEWDKGAFLPDSIAAALRMAAKAPGSHNSTGSIYIAFRAVDKFQARHRRYPGAVAPSLEADVTLFGTFVDDLLESSGAVSLRGSVNKDILSEMTRFGACELATTSALIGGLGAQEAIKIITRQMVPIDNTFVWNGIHGTSSTFSV